MSALKITYDGEQHVTAMQEPHQNIVAIDCPYTGKGEEFSPASLLGISLGSCMLLSMGAIAQRDNLDIGGTVVEIKFTGMDKAFPHVDTITLAFDIPHDFSEMDRGKLERAAGICPIMASFGDETVISAAYKYADAKAA